MKAISRAFLFAAVFAVAIISFTGLVHAENQIGPDGANYYSGTNAVEDQNISISLGSGATNLLNSFVDSSAGLDDNATTLIDIGFNFIYYGNVYNKLYVNLNGHLILEPPTGAPVPAISDLTACLAPTGAGGNNYTLWSNALPNAIIAPFLANLDFSVGNGSLMYQIVGAGNNKIFIVQWQNVPIKNSPSDTVSVQIQLHANGFIYFVYNNVPDALTDTTAGSRWTGLENENGTVGITYTTSQNNNPNLRVPYQLSSGLNILFYSDQDTAKLSVVSAQGNPSPPVGDKVPRPKNSLVTALVEATVEESDGIRWRCTGWVGTGSCPASWDGTGAPNYVVFEIEQDSSITWQWIQEYRLQVTSLGNNGNPAPPAGDNWYPAFTTVDLSVTSPFQSWTCAGYTGTGDIGTGTQTSFPIQVTQPSTIIWNWEYAGSQLSLGVISTFGSPSPAGLSLYAPGTTITATVQASVQVGGDTYLCTGYMGTGSAPANGTGKGNSVTFEILNNSTIQWIWEKQGGGTNLLTINSPFPPLPGYSRLYNDEYVYVSAQSPVEGIGNRWVCTGFTASAGSGIQAPSTASSFTFFITRNVTINFLWDIYYQLKVTSGTDELLGNPQLSVGGGNTLPVQTESWWSTDQPFRMSVTSPYIPANSQGIRYTCQGWVGTGNIPQEDSTTTEVVFFMDGPVAIDWLWQTEYQFTILNPRNLPGPTPSVGSYWWPANHLISGSCIDSTGDYSCVGYLGTGSLADSTAITFEFAINSATTIEWQWQLNLPAFGSVAVVDDNTSGLYTSVSRDSNTGYPWITYFDSAEGDLVVMNYDGEGWIKQTVATIGTTGQYASMVLDNQNYPHIAYYDSSSGDLWYAQWTGINWVRILVDADGDVGQYASIALITTVNGIVPSIAYYDASNRVVKYAERSGNGFAVQQVTQPAQGDRGKYCSLGFDGFRNVPSIAYYDATNGDLVYSTRIGGVWNSEAVHSDGDVGRYCSLAFNADNLPGISYYDLTNRDLKFVELTSMGWTAPVSVDTDGDVGQFSDLAYTINNIPMISYADYGREALKFAFYDGLQWVTTVLDDDGANVGWYTSITLDAYGYPGISYASANDIRYIAVAPEAAVTPGDQSTTQRVGGSGCFIATSAFGTMCTGTVETLCGVRDSLIAASHQGSALVSLYYSVSPAVAEDMRMSASSRAVVRALLSFSAK